MRPLILIGLALLFSTASSAAPVAIDNAGFEALYLGGNLPPVYAGDVPAGSFPTGAPPTDWTAYYESACRSAENSWAY